MGVYLSSPDTKKYSEDGENAFAIFGSSCMQGWRMNMEDAHIFEGEFDKNAALFAIFDGHGGAEVAKFSAKYFGKEFKSTKEYSEGNFEEALRKTFMKIDELLVTPEAQKELKTLKETDNEDNCAGCTANVLFIKDKVAYVANAGDSRTILIKGSKVVRLSEDHKPDNEIEKNRITNAGGFIIDGRVNGNLNLSRALGDLEYKSNKKLKPEDQLISAFPDIKKITLTAEDNFLVMGCDGVWEILNDDEIAKIIKDRSATEKKMSRVAEQFLDKCLAPDTSQGVGCDNMSSIILKLKQ